MDRVVGGVVEFVGLPAAGKTALAEATKDQLRRQVADYADGKQPRITTSSDYRAALDGPLMTGRAIARASITSPVAAGAVFRHLWRTRQQSVAKTARFLLYHQYLSRELRVVQGHDEIHLADQGLFQFLWRVHLTSTVKSMDPLCEIAAITVPTYEPALVVFVEVDHRTRVERARERGTEMREELHDPAHPLIQDDIESYTDMKRFLDRLQSAGICSADAIVIENADGALNRNASRLASAILETKSVRVVSDD